MCERESEIVDNDGREELRVCKGVCEREKEKLFHLLFEQLKLRHTEKKQVSLCDLAEQRVSDTHFHATFAENEVTVKQTWIELNTQLSQKVECNNSVINVSFFLFSL